MPGEYAIRGGLGPSFGTIDYPEKLNQVLTEVMSFTKIAEEIGKTLYELHDGDHGSQIITETSVVLPDQFQGFGTVHHLDLLIAFTLNQNIFILAEASLLERSCV